MAARFHLCAFACAATFAALPALADTHPDGPPPEGRPRHGQRADVLAFAGAQLEHERVVQGAPYCADAIHESVRALADGNRIVQRQPSRQCRDGQGRTRQELLLPGGRRNVFVRDPVAGESWMLDPQAKEAVRLDPQRPPAPGAEADGPMWQRVIGWGRDLRDRLLPRHANDSAAVNAGAPGSLAPPEAVRITRGGGPSAEVPPPYAGLPPPRLAFHARMMGPRGTGTVTPLPGESIDGLRADGKRTSWTIEAGRIGNEKPIAIVNETWSSPELGITLKSLDSDPIAGEESFRVLNITRGEPDASLFRVPADFRKVGGAPPMASAKP